MNELWEEELDEPEDPWFWQKMALDTVDTFGWQPIMRQIDTRWGWINFPACKCGAIKVVPEGNCFGMRDIALWCLECDHRWTASLVPPLDKA